MSTICGSCLPRQCISYNPFTTRLKQCSHNCFHRNLGGLKLYYACYWWIYLVCPPNPFGFFSTLPCTLCMVNISDLSEEASSRGENIDISLSSPPAPSFLMPSSSTSLQQQQNTPEETAFIYLRERGGGERERERERQTDRQTDRQTETETDTDREREIWNSNSKTLIFKDSSVRSIWTLSNSQSLLYYKHK